MNNDLTTFETMAAFKDMDIKLPMLEDVTAYCLDPIGGSYFEVPFQSSDPTRCRMVVMGQLVFKASDLVNLNITHQTV